MPYEFKITRQVEFYETDMAGIVHFANFFRYMEAAEHAFYRSLGFSVHTQLGDRTIGWPRLRADCRFSHPLRLEDTVEVHLLVREVARKTITYDFILRKMNADPPVESARGSITIISITRDGPGGEMKSVPLPEEVVSRIEAAPKELLEKALGNNG